MKAIRTALDGEALLPSALAVYMALTEVASNCKRDSFNTTQGFLGNLSGLSRSQVKRVLGELERIGVLHKSEAPAWNPSNPMLAQTCRYTLLDLDDSAPPGHVRTPSSNGATPSSIRTTPSQIPRLRNLSTVEEYKEESPEESELEESTTEKKEEVMVVRPAAARRAADPDIYFCTSSSLDQTELEGLVSMWPRPTLEPEHLREAVDLAVSEVGLDQLRGATRKWAKYWDKLVQIEVRSPSRVLGYARFLRDKTYLKEPPELSTRSSPSSKQGSPRREVCKDVLRDDQGWGAPVPATEGAAS